MINKFIHKLVTRKVFFAGMLMVFAMIRPVKTQSLQFSMEIQPELSIEVLQNLNFGTVVTNSGTHKVLLGDAKMGVFKIKALATQNALLTLEKPEYLGHKENKKNNIPIILHAAYSGKPYEYGNARPFAGNNLWVSLSPETPTLTSPTWENGYVFIFGDIEVSEVSRGSYSGTLVLNVVYQ